MTDQSHNPDNFGPDSTSPNAPPRRRIRGGILIAGALALAVATGAVVSSAIGGGFGGGFGPGGFGPPGWHGGMMGRMDPATIEDRADRAIRHLAVEIDATNDQQEKLRAIVKSAVKDLLPMRDQAAGVRQRARDLLTAPTIDRTAIEAFRAEQVTKVDAFSKRVTQALTDAAEVLTPAQRTQVRERLESHRGGWRPWMRG